MVEHVQIGGQRRILVGVAVLWMLLLGIVPGWPHVHFGLLLTSVSSAALVAVPAVMPTLGAFRGAASVVAGMFGLTTCVWLLAYSWAPFGVVPPLLVAMLPLERARHPAVAVPLVALLLALFGLGLSRG